MARAASQVSGQEVRDEDGSGGARVAWVRRIGLKERGDTTERIVRGFCGLQVEVDSRRDHTESAIVGSPGAEGVTRTACAQEDGLARCKLPVRVFIIVDARAA